MSRKSKIDPVLKVELVERYLHDEIGALEAGRIAGLSGNGIDTFMKWVSIYKNDGPPGLLDQKSNKTYSNEIMINAVNDYLDGKGSQQNICEKYGIPTLLSHCSSLIVQHFPIQLFQSVSFSCYLKQYMYNISTGRCVVNNYIQQRSKHSVHIFSIVSSSVYPL